jgi:hypothetical protein
MTIGFIDTSLNLDPEYLLPGSGVWVRNLIAGFALLAFAQWAGNKFWELTVAFAQAQTGGVPNLTYSVLGTGGNIGGPILMAIVATALVAAWIGVFTWFFSSIGGRFSGLASNFTGPGNAIALYLITNYIPVSFLLSLAWTRVLLTFGMAKLVMLSAAISRFMPGR